MRIALAQINPTVGDLRGNKALIQRYIRKALAGDADIVAFPEMAVCGYPPEDLLYKKHFVSDCIKSLNALAETVKDIIVVVGCIDVDKNYNLYNAAAVIADGKIKEVCHKQELPNYGVFDEKRYFKPGKNNKLLSLNKALVGINICEDIWVEKGIMQQQVKKGAGVIINISSSPYDVGKLRQREKLLRDRAIQSKSYICYTNLVGGQDELVFDGGSLIYDPKGNIIVHGKPFEEDLVLADLDVAGKKKIQQSGTCRLSAPKKTKKKITYKKTKRLEEIERIHKALVVGTRDYIRKNGFQKVVIGLSGGIDSAVVAAIAVEAFGKEYVVGVTMPSQYTTKGTKTDAIKLAENLKIKLLEVPIKGIYQKYIEEFKPLFKDAKEGLAEENIQARIRGNILMALSNKFGWLVLTTGNKSEFAVGYCTLYGDMSGGFAVIKDIPKTKVYELANFINSTQEIIPKSTISRAPSAELRDNQKDEDSLPPYNVLDEMLYRYVEQHKSLVHGSKGKNKDLGKDIISLVDRSEYKRRQAPPGVKITPRAFGKDWRLPITNKYKEF